MVRTVNLEQRCGGFRSTARKLIAVCMGGALLLSSGQAGADQPREGLLRRSLSGPIDSVEPLFKNAVATCDFTGEGAAAATAAGASLTLSQKSLTATLVCTGTKITKVPASTEHVCDPRQKGQSGNCQFDGSQPDGNEVKLKNLLGANRYVHWTQRDEKAVATTQTWMLQLEEADLPLSDKSFLVGCQDATGPARSSGTKKACKVPVNVEARPSAVGENNLVTCAYGKNSNPAPLMVEMTTENNTLTLQCGSEGILHPTTYETRYCDPEEADLKKCNEKDYVGILPSFVESWWTNADAKTSATLTIPVTEFPESEQKFRVGCVPNTTNSQGPDAATKARKNDDSEADATMSNCSVVVTVKSGSSASSTCQMVATVSGAAALLGLLVGSL
uniref:SRS domain-containing protein n=1 Tax=Neospora caninum (strain Liverpool) TaxID=572307 RepID=F0JAV4_NEOCL|nr:SRS domain-containing protein [Neospora caninum Liverpool]CEL71220.1 TPA: SRS domain-containing protein [Neospora caninum Liverpool]